MVQKACIFTLNPDSRFYINFSKGTSARSQPSADPRKHRPGQVCRVLGSGFKGLVGNTGTDRIANYHAGFLPSPKP